MNNMILEIWDSPKTITYTNNHISRKDAFALLEPFNINALREASKHQNGHMDLRMQMI